MSTDLLPGQDRPDFFSGDPLETIVCRATNRRHQLGDQRRLADKCVGARVNDQMVNLGYQLKSGDIVEIITDKNRKTPNPDWIDMVKTSMAKSKIRNAFNKVKK